jgi:hypothetical protein
MADEASDTFGGGTKAVLGVFGFLLPMGGLDQLLTAAPVLPIWGSISLLVAGPPLLLAPAFWKRCRASTGTHSPGSDLRDAPLVQPPTPPAAVARDEWFQDAVCFALYGHWPTAGENVFQEPDVIEKVGSIVEQMRELAGEGNFLVWGKAHEYRLYELIQPSFWINNQIDYMSLWGPPKTPKTEQITGIRNTDAVYRALMVSRAQVEAVWSPPTGYIQQAATGAIASLSMVVTRVNQPLRDAARIAFETIQGTDSEEVISGLNPTPEKRLGYFMSDMAGQAVRHYGKKPPSSVPMEIPLTELLNMHPADGENALIEIFEKIPRYVDVTVEGDSFRAYLDKLKTRFP